MSTNGNIVAPNSYFDTIINTGAIPVSTDTAADTVTFNPDTGWATGDVVRVVQSYKAVSPANTGLVTPPTAKDDTNTATYFIRLGSGVYSFHPTYADAVAGINTTDITGAFPTTGEIIVVGENDTLPFLGQAPINESLVPVSTKFTLTQTPFSAVSSFNGTTEQIVIADTTGLANGDRVRVSIAFGGLSVTTTYWVRVIDGVTVELYNGYAAAIAAPSISGRIGLSGTGVQLPPAGTNLDKVDPDDESVTFTTDPLWETGTPVRVAATAGGLSAGTTYYVRNLGSGVYSFFTSQLESLNTDANVDPLSGRKDLTAPITTGVFANLTTVSFPQAHGWATGTVVRVSASVGGLASGTYYYVREIDGDTVSFHTTLANAVGNISPMVFTAPMTAVVTQVFNGWCVDNDRFIGGGEYIANILSSYDNSFPDSTNHPKDSHGTDAGIMPVNTSAIPSSTDYTTNERATFSTGLGWADNQAVRVTANTGGGALLAGTTYYIDVTTTSPTILSFHTATPVAAGNKVNLLGDVTETVFRAESIDFAVTTNWPDGTKVKVDVDDGGLLASIAYYAWAQNIVGGAADANSISFYDTREHAQAGGLTGLITLTDPMEIATKVYVPENLVEYPENLDVMNWVLNQNFIGTLATGKTPSSTDTTTTAPKVASATNFNNTIGPAVASTKFVLTTTTGPNVTATDTVNETVDLSAAAFIDGDRVQVSGATGGGLSAGITYYVRKIDGDTISFHSNWANYLSNTKVNLTALIAITRTVDPVDTDDETVSFAAAHSFVTGDPVKVSVSGGGLAAGTVYYVRESDANTISFFSSPEAATNTDDTDPYNGRINLTAALATTTTVNPILATEDAVTVTAHGWSTGQPVRVTATGGGLSANTTYYVEVVDADTFSFHTALPVTPQNKVNLTAAITAGIYQAFDDTITFAVPHLWTNGTAVQVESNVGGLTAYTTYYVRSIDADTIALYDTAAHASAAGIDGRIDLTGDINVTIRPLFTEGDIQRTVWELIENTPGNPGYSAERVAEILALADAAVGIDNVNVTYVPDCGGTVAVLLQPFEIEGETNEQITIAQVTVAQIPNYCVEGYNCQTVDLPLGSVSGMKFNDLNGNGVKEDGDLGLAGWFIFVDYDGNGVFSYTDVDGIEGFNAAAGDVALEPYDVTSADDPETLDINELGAYLITGILPGTWTILEVAQPDWVATVPAGGAISIPVTAESYAYTQDFGNFQLFNICGVKVWDVDRDGAKGGISDTGDFRLERVRIYWDANGSGSWEDPELNVFTDVNGAWCLNDLGPVAGGVYTIKEDMSMAVQASDEWQSSGAPAPIPAVSGTDVSTADFYNYKFPPGEYWTYSQGGWSGKGVPGQYLLANFATAFPNGLWVPRSPEGTAADVLLLTGAQVQAFLKDKKSTNLETQFVALSLSVGFDNETLFPNFDTGTSSLGDLTLCNLTGQYAIANALTISDYLAEVAFYLDGSASYLLGLASGDLIQVLNNITLGFDAGVGKSPYIEWVEMNLC